MIKISGLKKGSHLVHSKQRARQKRRRTAQRHGKIRM